MKQIIPLAILICTCLVGCIEQSTIDKAWIEQRVEVTSILEDEYLVSTLVWAGSQEGWYSDAMIEYSEYNSSVKCEEIQRVKKEQMIEAVKIEKLLKEKLHTFNNCDTN